MRSVLLVLCTTAVLGCDAASLAPSKNGMEPSSRTMKVDDPHSFSKPWEVSIRRLELDLEVDFEARTLRGRATLDLDRRTPADELILDTWGLEIDAVRLDDGEAASSFSLGEEREFLGRPLRIALEEQTKRVAIDYSTSPDATALQWLTPEQTGGGEQPFLFTQSQAILARSWIPLQDTPSVRMTWTARIRCPPELMAVMSAENPMERRADGVYFFEMPQAVPSYLMALAVGDLAFQSLGPRSGVFAEPRVLASAAWEFADTETMIEAAESLYGPYLWGRYDILVLPPSFPFGGMENPRLTFATPTILAGDRSLVSLVAHELAHSWSGNLVTNATWEDLWLNEGFTVYFEHRIMEEVFGREYSEMLAVLTLHELEQELERLGPTSPDTHLHLALQGRNPDDGLGSIAYDKGYFFLRAIEEAVGRQRWDAFLRVYFEDLAFQTTTSDAFVDFLQAELLDGVEGVSRESLLLDQWIWGPGLPANMPTVESEALDAVERELDRWSTGTPAADLDSEGWETQRTLHFLHGLPEKVRVDEMSDLDAAFGFSETGNSEVLAAWLKLAIRSNYKPAYPALESFLTRQGRRKFLTPLYGELVKTDEGHKWAREIYRRARPGYHPVSTQTLDPIVLGGESG